MKPYHHRMRVWDGDKFLYLNTTNGFWYSVDSDKCDGEVWPYLSVQHYLKEQCSGLKSKSGKLIYESDDIMAHHDRYRVLFENGAFYVEKEGLTGYRVLLSRLVGSINGTEARRINSFEIVGHAHENPELL